MQSGAQACSFTQVMSDGPKPHRDPSSAPSPSKKIHAIHHVPIFASRHVMRWKRVITAMKYSRRRIRLEVRKNLILRKGMQFPNPRINAIKNFPLAHPDCSTAIRIGAGRQQLRSPQPHSIVDAAKLWRFPKYCTSFFPWSGSQHLPGIQRARTDRLLPAVPAALRNARCSTSHPSQLRSCTPGCHTSPVYLPCIISVGLG